MRAIEPTKAGTIEIAGFQIGYELFGDECKPTVLLLPTWQITHSRLWKMQVPYLARFRQVVTFDPPGNGGGERTTDPRAFEYDRIVDQALGLLDHFGIGATDVIAFSRGCAYGLLLAARCPQRVRRLVLIGNGTTPAGWPPGEKADFWQCKEAYTGWEKYNGPYWLEHYDDWVDFFVNDLFPEPHSSKAIDDCIAWAAETTPEILVQTTANPQLLPQLSPAEVIAKVACPVLLMHGECDTCDPIAHSHALVAARPEWPLVTFEQSGHAPHVRDPVRVNLILGEFLSGNTL